MTKTQLRSLKTATIKLTKWDTSGKVFGHYTVIRKKTSNTAKADKIYEFYCLLRLIEDLLLEYTIKIVNGKKTKKIFPSSPGSKKEWAYFEIENKNNPSNKYQICYGTNIKLSTAPKTTIAPDISIQKDDASMDPDETMVELIMDAKFKYKESVALPVNQIHAFIQCVNALKTQNAKNIPLVLTLLTNIKSNCLLTNGKALKDQDDYCKLNSIIQVEDFDIKKTFNTVG